MLIVLGIIIAAILVGAGLYLYGPAELREAPPVEQADAAPVLIEEGAGPVEFSVLAEGPRASLPARKNYAVYDAEEFVRLWALAYGDDVPPLPGVDFDTHYVIGAFAGEKPTGGYGIDITGVEDSGNVRTVSMTLSRPGQGCIVTQAATSPFQFIVLPITDREHEREEREEVSSCR